MCSDVGRSMDDAGEPALLADCISSLQELYRDYLTAAERLLAVVEQAMWPLARGDVEAYAATPRGLFSLRDATSLCAELQFELQRLRGLGEAIEQLGLILRGESGPTVEGG